MAYKKIGAYGLIGNGYTVALVGNDGSVDWMCLPYMDSPSVFAALLDDEKGGRFSIRPSEAWDAVQSYLPRTNILKTQFRTASGEVELVDFMHADSQAENDTVGRSRLLRRIKGIRGRLQLSIECAPRFDYARRVPEWSRMANHWVLRADEMALSLFSSRQIEWQGERAYLDIGQGETLWFGISYDAEEQPPEAACLEELLRDTEKFWVQWVRAQETGKYSAEEFWREILDRSGLVLKLLQFRDTGAIAAAGSCSLPAIIHGERNWDYRFSWIRDTSMTLSALFEMGHITEASLYLDWLKKIARQQDGPELKVLYKLREPVPPPGEKELEHLSGYKGSTPVRVGQLIVVQRQHDIYGELLEMIFDMSHFVGKIAPDDWSFIRPLVDHVVTLWREQDHGIWEQRMAPRHYTHSKLMCWVALDRGIKVAEHYGFPADIERWTNEREIIRDDILRHGYNPNVQSFTQHYQTDALDASLLRIPLVGFLPIDDPRVARTIEAIERELLINGVILRYKTEDGLAGQEQGFLICLFWYLRCLIRQRRFQEVEDYLRQINGYGNHLGLFGEQYDPHYREITGNFPQAFSHIGYATTILEYLDARRPQIEPPPISLWKKLRLLFYAETLTPVAGEQDVRVVEDPSKQVKQAMNILRGQFYDGHRQRIDYRLIHSSNYFQVFLKAVAALRFFDPATLRTDHEKIAFWVNVYNTLVIHGVIELGIRESVKEVPLFFDRVQYVIGRRLYTLNDIEHGILRDNAVPPKRLRRRFTNDDPRAAYCVRQPDPRIHFALVCASRTCPPIEAYDAEQLNEQLDSSARVFINASTTLYKDKKLVAVSEIFEWYRADFSSAGAELGNYLANYMYHSGDADWLRRNAEALSIRHVPYDWRLNR